MCCMLDSWRNCTRSTRATWRRIFWAKWRCVCTRAPCSRCRRAEARGGRQRAGDRRAEHCRARKRVQRGTEACARVVRESGAAGRRSAAPERGRRRSLRLASSNSRYYQNTLAGIFTGSQSRRLDGHLHGREAARQALASRSRQMDSRRCSVCNLYLIHLIQSSEDEKILLYCKYKLVL